MPGTEQLATGIGPDFARERRSRLLPSLQQTADLAVPDAWMGWEAVDAMNRIFAGQESTISSSVLNSEPDRLFTTGGNKPAFSGPWTGDYDYAAAYQKLWGV